MLSAPESKLCDIMLGAEPRCLLIRFPLSFPTSACPRELAHRFIKHHNLPIYFHTELSEKLQTLIISENNNFYKTQDRNRLQALRDGLVDKFSVANKWAAKYNQNSYLANMHSPEDLATMYHHLVHSPCLTPLLSLEHSYAGAVGKLVAEKEKAVEELAKSQAVEMQKAVAAVGVQHTDDFVNHLAATQLEAAQLIESQWDSRISALQEDQKREFRSFIERSYAGEEVASPVTPKEAFSVFGSDAESVQPVQEESFTIHLGTQMKQMHNLRLLAANPLQLCKFASCEGDRIPPQRLQTSLSLFSHNLNGLVLLVDDRINSYTGIKKDFGRICSRSTELHFPELGDQLESVRNIVSRVVQWRKDHPPPQYDYDEESQGPLKVPQHLKSGDFYITRHSNLSDAHVVFHMVVDDTLRSSDMNSRHSVILGLRNVLKVACLSDITTLTVPLLLAHSLSEEMTISWCQKRAELVFKCIKGFMIEMTSWGGAEMKNLQFLVPPGISEDLFQTLASMLQSIFRVSNPLNLKSS